MRDVFLALTTLIVASGGNTVFAQYDCPGGQRPVPPAVAERMALPLCRFGATKRWAGNMCQLCNSRNMYPNPFVPYPVPLSRYYGLRLSSECFHNPMHRGVLSVLHLVPIA